MADEPRQINFAIVPGDDTDAPHTYANFCAVAHTPFDFTLTFCEVQPLSEEDIKTAEQDHVVKAPVRARVVMPLTILESLVSALQDRVRMLKETNPPAGWNRGPVH